MRCGQKYRKNVHFVRDMGTACTRLDRNQRAKLLHMAEALERGTKRINCRNGVLGIPAIIILRALVLGFHNAKTGLCCPSYDAIQAKTGLCRQSIASGLAKLEASGLVRITRRLVREIGDFGVIVCRQGSNLYGFAIPASVDLGQVQGPPRLRGFFLRGPSLGRGRNPHQGVFNEVKVPAYRDSPCLEGLHLLTSRVRILTKS